MRSIIAIALFGAVLAFPGVSAGEASGDECQTRCADEKTARDAACPRVDEDSEQARAQCLLDSQSAYASCMNDCQQPAPAPDSAPAPDPAPVPEN